MFTKINKQLLKKSLAKAGIADKIEAGDTIKNFEEYINSALGKKALTFIKPLYVKNQNLTIRVADSLVAAELKKQETEIISFINKKTNSSLKRLHFLS